MPLFHCKKCRKEKELDLEQLRLKHPAISKLNASEIADKMRCECGHKGMKLVLTLEQYGTLFGMGKDYQLLKAASDQFGVKIFEV